MNRYQTPISIIVALVLTAIAGALYSSYKVQEAAAPSSAVTDFVSCAAAGNPVMTSYPAQCSANGTTYTEKIDEQVPTYTFLDPGSAASSSPASAGGCVISGCSSELCVDAASGDTMSSCIYKPQYACYQGATCARQANGQCGWTETPQLDACLADPSGSGDMPVPTVIDVQ